MPEAILGSKTSVSAAAERAKHPSMKPEASALVSVGRMLLEAGYSFVTVTPETHRRINERDTVEARSLRDVFGWSRPFERELLPSPMFELLQRAAVLDAAGAKYRSTVRFSTLGGTLVVHSSYPTVGRDAVFFGPDTYRFCALLRRSAPHAQRLLDMGCGTGAGAICLADRASQLLLSDINPRALELAAVNICLAALSADYQLSDGLQNIAGLFDLIVANPPYLRDIENRAYRDGGGRFGEALSVRMVCEALRRLSPAGTLIMYTGSAIVDGEDTFYTSVEPLLRAPDLRVQYEELDPDVFGDELSAPIYAGVERIAVVALQVGVT